MKKLIAVLCVALTACHAAAGPSAPASGTVNSEEAKPPLEAAMIARSKQLIGQCNRGERAACDAAGQVASALESRGYCQPDGGGHWKKTPVCAQINGAPDLMLGNVESPVTE